jgi:hypothetical protein
MNSALRLLGGEKNGFSYRDGRKMENASASRDQDAAQRTANDLLDEAMTLLTEKYGQQRELRMFGS